MWTNLGILKISSFDAWLHGSSGRVERFEQAGLQRTLRQEHAGVADARGKLKSEKSTKSVVSLVVGR
jgi:hypothetical protein